MTTGSDRSGTTWRNAEDRAFHAELVPTNRRSNHREQHGCRLSTLTTPCSGRGKAMDILGELPCAPRWSHRRWRAGMGPWITIEAGVGDGPWVVPLPLRLLTIGVREAPRDRQRDVARFSTLVTPIAGECRRRGRIRRMDGSPRWSRRLSGASRHPPLRLSTLVTPWSMRDSARRRPGPLQRDFLMVAPRSPVGGAPPPARGWPIAPRAGPAAGPERTIRAFRRRRDGRAPFGGSAWPCSCSYS